MPTEKKRVRVRRTTTVVFTEDQVKQILRDKAKAPKDADVKFDDNWFSEATVEWSTEHDEDESDA